MKKYLILTISLLLFSVSSFSKVLHETKGVTQDRCAALVTEYGGSGYTYGHATGSCQIVGHRISNPNSKKVKFQRSGKSNLRKTR